MKKLLNAYYELTVIPSIVLGCITTLGWYGIHYLQCGFAYATPTEAVFAFLFFLGIMTAEDVWKWFRNLSNAGSGQALNFGRSSLPYGRR